MAFSIYLVRCGDGSVYTGIAMDVKRRLAEHERQRRGAKYLRGKGPYQLLYHQEIGSRSLAQRIEHRVKRLPSEEKADVGRLRRRISGMIDEFSGRP
jgi:putative endonuclease